MHRDKPGLTLASGDYLPVVRDFALSRGIQPSELLEGSDLSPADFIHPPELISNFIVNRVGQNLYNKLDEPMTEAVFYGLEVRSSSHGALGMAIQTSATLRAGLKLLEKYYNTRLAAQYPEIIIDDQHVSLTLITYLEGISHSPEVQRFFDLSTMVSMAQSISFALGQSSLGAKVIIEIDTEEPKDFPHYALPNSQFIFQANKPTMRFPIAWLDLPFESENKALCEAALSQCEDELRKVKPQDLIDRIRDSLFQCEGRLPSIEEVAERNFMSVATLKRKLNELNYNYLDLKNEVRLSTAKTQLANTQHSIDLISEQLGFSDNSNFTKFFKKHTGMTPKQFRTNKYKGV